MQNFRTDGRGVFSYPPPTIPSHGFAVHATQTIPDWGGAGRHLELSAAAGRLNSVTARIPLRSMLLAGSPSAVPRRRIYLPLKLDPQYGSPIIAVRRLDAPAFNLLATSESAGHFALACSARPPSSFAMPVAFLLPPAHKFRGGPGHRSRVVVGQLAPPRSHPAFYLSFFQLPLTLCNSFAASPKHRIQRQRRHPSPC